MRVPRPVVGRSPVNLGTILPGVKQLSVKMSNQWRASRAESRLPVALACAAKAMAAKDSL